MTIISGREEFSVAELGRARTASSREPWVGKNDMNTKCISLLLKKFTGCKISLPMASSRSQSKPNPASSVTEDCPLFAGDAGFMSPRVPLRTHVFDIYHGHSRRQHSHSILQPLARCLLFLLVNRAEKAVKKPGINIGFDCIREGSANEARKCPRSRTHRQSEKGRYGCL